MARILIVDENQSHIDIVEEALRQYKHEYKSEWQLSTHAANTMSRALELTKYNNYEMVIVDIMTAKSDSWGFLKEIRKKFPDALKVPIVVLSGVGAVELEYQAVRYGASAWFIKFPPLQHFAREIFKLLLGA